MFVSFYTSALAPDEMITWISIPSDRPAQGWGFVEYARQHGDYGLAGAGCVVSLGADGRIDSVRAGVLSVADRPVLFTAGEAVGHRPTDALCEQLAQQWAAETQFVADDADYARRLCTAALTEAMGTAVRRAAEKAQAHGSE